jgi:hypothetical protein
MDHRQNAGDYQSSTKMHHRQPRNPDETAGQLIQNRTRMTPMQQISVIRGEFDRASEREGDFKTPVGC